MLENATEEQINDVMEVMEESGVHVHRTTGAMQTILAAVGPTAGKQLQRAVQSGKLSAKDVAELTFAAIEAGRFYIITHPAIMPTVHLRHEDIEQQRNPIDPLSLKPEVKGE